MKANEVRKTLGITQKTLNSYSKKGIIKYVAINPYHYIYNDEDVYKLIGLSSAKKEKTNVIYSRVSLPKQKNDLISQEKRLTEFCISKGIVLSKQYQDIKSGMNFSDRKCFNELLEEIIKGNINNIVIEHKDRLCRFGFDLFESFCKFFGTQIIITTQAVEKNYEQELTEDLVSIIHYFSMKSYSHRRKLNQFKKELQEK